MSDAQQAKNEGSAAWSAGDYDKAIDKFSQAINFGGDKEFLKILYSNRSAAYLKVNKASLALTDANKCIEIDSQWPKGYTRKGDALLAQRKYTDAYNAYNNGLRVAPNDSTLTEKAEQAMRGIRNEASRSQPSGSNTTSSTPLPTGVTLYLKYAILACSLLYLLPLGSFITTNAFRIAGAIFAGLYIHNLYTTHGFPKFTAEYGQKIFPDPSLMKVFLGIMLSFSPRPYIFAILPLLLIEIISFIPLIFQYARDNSHLVESYTPMLSRFIPNIDRIRVSDLFSNALIPQASVALLQFAAICEVSQGVFLIFELILPTRNILQMYLWWQYLRMRYMLDQTNYLKQAFSRMDVMIAQVLAHQYCPAIVRQGYGYVKSYLAKQVEIPTAEQAREQASGSMLSKCSIM